MFRNEVHTGSKWKGGDFLHREALVSVAKSYTYDDGPEETGQDAFSREPFVVMFSSKHTGMVLWLELYSCFCITLIMMWILIQTFVRGSSWDMLVTSPLSFSCGVSASVTVNTLLRSLLFCSCERLYSDPSAHFPRISCSGAKCSLWRGGRCPRSLEQWCIYSLQVKIIYLVEKHTLRLTLLSLQDIVLLGDFNAGCSYVSGSDWQQIRIFTDKTFHWLITDAADTTVSQTVCPYDR